MTLPETAIVRRRSALHEATFGEEMIALDIARGAYFSFNETARSIWEWLETPRSIDALAALVIEGFDIGAPEARAALKTLIETLTREGLVEVQSLP